MANNLIKVLSKKGKLTGAEVANLVILNTVYQLKNNTTETPISKAELQTAINGLTDNTEIRAYNQRIQIRDFIYEVMNKRLLLEEMQKKQYLILREGLTLFSLKIRELGFKKPLQMTYKEYETFKEEKLHNYLYRDDGTDSEVIYIFLVLKAIQKLFDTEDRAGDIIRSYKGKLTKEEEAFLKQYVAKYDYEDSPETELIKKHKFKEYFITLVKMLLKEDQTIDTSEGTTTLKEYKPVKADIALYLDDYIKYLMYDKGKGKEDIVKVIKEYKDIVEYAKDYVDTTLFKGDIKDFSIDDLLSKNIKRKELLEKYDFDILEEVLGAEEILITNGSKGNFLEIYYNILSSYNKDQPIDLGDSLQNIQANGDLLYNFKTMLNLVADFIDLKEVKELIADNEEQNTDLLYLHFTRLFVEIADISPTAEQQDFLRETLKRIEDKLTNATVKRADEKQINKCKELLNSRNNFNDIRDDFYFTLLKGGAE